MEGGDNVDNHAVLMVAPKARLAAVAAGIAPLESGTLEALGERLCLHALVEQGTLRRLPAPAPAEAPPVRRASAAQTAAMQRVWAKHDTLMKIEAAADRPQSFTASLLTSAGWQPLTEGLRLRSDGRFHADGRATSPRAPRRGPQLPGVTRASGRRRWPSPGSRTPSSSPTTAAPPSGSTTSPGCRAGSL